MIKTFCKICRKQFWAKPWHLRQGWSKCCSKKCRDEAQKKGKFLKCCTCGKPMWKTPADLRGSKSGKLFCSKSCQTFWRNKFYSGRRHAFWSGGFHLYRKKLLNNSKNHKCMLCGQDDLRVLQAHHRDRNRRNNDIKNLAWLCINCHRLVHLHGVKLP